MRLGIPSQMQANRSTFRMTTCRFDEVCLNRVELSHS
jgi:hypothetical protein